MSFQKKAIPRKVIPAKYTSTKFYILLAFLFITITLLIAVSIYLIKHLPIQKHLLPFNDTSKSKEIDIKNILYKMESNNKLKEIDIKNHPFFIILTT